MSFLLEFKDWVSASVGIDDACDRLNRKYTSLVLLICVVPLFSKQYIGEPVQCFTPTYFTHAQAEYVNNYCWTASTYYMVDTDGSSSTNNRQSGNLMTQQANQGLEPEFVGPNTKGKKERVSYYQWVPILLALQAFLFHFPFMLWHSFAINSGVQVKSLINGARQVAKFHIKKQYKDALLLEFCEEFDRFMSITHNDNQQGCCQKAKQYICVGRHYGNYLYFLFLLIKVFYIINLCSQLYCLTLFLGSDHILHGVNVLYGLIYEETWISSLRFPIQTICEYSAHQQGNLLHYSVQCVLPINLYNDKLYATLTLWFITLSILTFFSIFLWLWRNAHRNRMTFVKGYLSRLKKLKNREDKRLCRKFTSIYLRRDGIFILQLIEINIGGIVVAAVLDKLWDDYKRRQMHEVHGGSVNQSQGGVWPPANIGTDGMPLINTQTEPPPWRPPSPMALESQSVGASQSGLTKRASQVTIGLPSPPNYSVALLLPHGINKESNASASQQQGTLSGTAIGMTKPSAPPPDSL